MNVESEKEDSTEKTIVEVQYSKIKKQNSKMYYITFTEQFRFFKKGFYKVIIFKFK